MPTEREEDGATTFAPRSSGSWQRSAQHPSRADCQASQRQLCAALKRGAAGAWKGRGTPRRARSRPEASRGCCAVDETDLCAAHRRPGERRIVAVPRRIACNVKRTDRRSGRQKSEAASETTRQAYGGAMGSERIAVVAFFGPLASLSQSSSELILDEVARLSVWRRTKQAWRRAVAIRLRTDSSLFVSSACAGSSTAAGTEILPRPCREKLYLGWPAGGSKLEDGGVACADDEIVPPREKN